MANQRGEQDNCGKNAECQQRARPRRWDGPNRASLARRSSGDNSGHRDDESGGFEGQNCCMRFQHGLAAVFQGRFEQSACASCRAHAPAREVPEVPHTCLDGLLRKDPAENSRLLGSFSVHTARQTAPMLALASLLPALAPVAPLRNCAPAHASQPGGGVVDLDDQPLRQHRGVDEAAQRPVAAQRAAGQPRRLLPQAEPGDDGADARPQVPPELRQRDLHRQSDPGHRGGPPQEVGPAERGRRGRDGQRDLRRRAVVGARHRQAAARGSRSRCARA